MSEWTGETVAQALEIKPPAAVTLRGVSTDTRTLAPGDLFVALVGDRFDGHAFLEDAAARGAAAAVVFEGAPVPEGLATFRVPDTLVALGKLARARRREIHGPVVAVTGTNGKTATKEMVARVLGARWPVHATRANRNNLVGVPLTILDAPPHAEALVVEVGASVPGEIARLRGIVEPTVGVVTNVSTGHLEGFRSLEGVLEEKLSLLDGVAVAIVGCDPDGLAVRAQRRARRVIVAGTGQHADHRPTAWRLDDGGCGVLEFGDVTVELPIVGRHQIENATLAMAVAEELGVDAAAAALRLASVALPGGRCELLRRGGIVVLHDAYNANPGSMEASLETAKAMRRARPLVVVLGTMLELGDASLQLHRGVAKQVMAASPAVVAVMGTFVEAFAEFAGELGDRLITADDPVTLGERLAPRLGAEAFVLVKASRGVQLERAIPYLLPG